MTKLKFNTPVYCQIWQTSDGKIFFSEPDAHHHQLILDFIKWLNKNDLNNMSSEEISNFVNNNMENIDKVIDRFDAILSSKGHAE